MDSWFSRLLQNLAQLSSSAPFSHERLDVHLRAKARKCVEKGFLCILIMLPQRNTEKKTFVPSFFSCGGGTFLRFLGSCRPYVRAKNTINKASALHHLQPIQNAHLAQPSFGHEKEARHIAKSEDGSYMALQTTQPPVSAVQLLKTIQWLCHQKLPNWPFQLFASFGKAEAHHLSHSMLNGLCFWLRCTWLH